ncbi:MAG: uracil-DNA glycosylase, partial [Bacteroidota bacterium]
MLDKKLLIEVIKDQQEIFGDFLFENVNTAIEESMKKKIVVKETSENKISVAENLFLEDFQKAESLK